MNEHSKRPAAFPGEPEDKGQQFRVQTILIALRCWWKIAAPLGILLAVGAAAAVYFTSKPQYTAFVLLKIPDRPAYLLENHWVTDPRKTVENELELMRSPAVIDPVASIPAVANTPEIARERHPTLALRKLLRVSARGRSDYFSIEFTSEDPQRAALVVNAVADAYLNLQRSSYYERQEKTIRLLEEQQTRQHTLVEELRGKFTTLYKQQTGVDPFPIGPNAGVMQLNDPTALLQSRLLEAKIDQLFLKAQFDADQELLNKEPSDPPQTKVKEHVDADPEVNLLETKIASNKAKMREYEAVSKNLEQHPGYQDLKAGVTEYESQLEKLRSELTDEIKGQMIAAAKLHRDDGLKALQDRLATTNFAVEILEEKIASDKAGRKTQNSETVMLADARYDYETARSFHQAIKQKVDSLRIEQGADNPVELFRKAVTPPAPDGDAPYKKMAMVAMAAFCLPFGLAVLAEHLYRRVSSRDQLEISNGIHVVGEVTSLPRRSRSTKKGKKPVNRDLQLFEESIDGLRTYLTLVHSVQGLQVLAVTSAVSREGKTSLAAQLAISIASATGESTLLIDGDMRSPDVHRAFDIQRGPGLVDVLCGDVSAEDVINADYSESLHLMPAGALSSSPHKLLGSDEFRNMLDGLRGKYRHILIDTPPLLPASEALLLARAADAALVCVRRDYSRMSQTVEAFSRLRSAGVKVAGAVLNGIPARMYVYRYGAYYSERPRLTGAPAEDLAG